jgi:hypothetical protein
MLRIYKFNIASSYKHRFNAKFLKITTYIHNLNASNSLKLNANLIKRSCNYQHSISATPPPHMRMALTGIKPAGSTRLDGLISS